MGLICLSLIVCDVSFHMFYGLVSTLFKEMSIEIFGSIFLIFLFGSIFLFMSVPVVPFSSHLQSFSASVSQSVQSLSRVRLFVTP